MLGLLLGAGLLALCFRREGAAAAAVWMQSTAYGHCFLVLPIAGFLAWERRNRFDPGLLRPTGLAAWPAAGAALAWFAADRLGVMEGRQLAALALVESLLLSALGWRLFRAFAVPLGFLVFLVPVGAFLVPLLQAVTAHFIVAGLQLLHIPNYADGNVIEIPEGRFFVAEACAGLRFLTASLAFGVLYAVTMYRGPVRRVLFIVASGAIPVAANGLRALGIVLAGHWLGDAEAAAADHLIYGWVFFSAIVLAMTVVGLLFRDRAGPASRPVPPAPPLRARPALPIALVVLIACAGPAWSALAVSGAAGGPVLGAVPEGCTAERPPGGTWQDLRCGPLHAELRLQPFSPHAAPDVLLHAAADAAGLPAPGAEPEPGPPPETARAAAVWVGGESMTGSLRDRLAQARRSLLSGSDVPVVVSAVVSGGNGADRQHLADALVAHPPVPVPGGAG